MVSIKKTVISWEEPPSPPGRPKVVDRWEGVAEALINKPDQWALIDATTRSVAQYLVSLINKQKAPFTIPEKDQGNWRFRASSHYDTGREVHKVYARYEDLREE